MKELTSAIQEALLAVLCYDDQPGGSTFVRGLIDSGDFDLYYRELAEQAYQYLDRYGRPSGEHTLDLVEGLVRSYPEREDAYRDILLSLESTKDGVNREYVINQASSFIRRQRLKKGLAQCIDLLDSEAGGSIDEAEKVLKDSMESSGELFDPGLRITDAKALDFLTEAMDPAFPTGVKPLDQLRLGPARKRLHVFMALPGKGKSWWLVNLAKRALMNRYKVCYITLELSESEVAQRCFQSLLSISKRETKVHTQRFEIDGMGRFESFSGEVEREVLSFASPDIRGRIIKKIHAHPARFPLIIKGFPTGQLTIRQMRSYLDGLESVGFIPDLVIVDYLDLMQIDPRYYRHELGELYKLMRGLAVERNIAAATASQANREGASSDVIGVKHVAEDFSKIATADVVLTYSQTVQEHDRDLARLFVAKGRTERDQFSILISQKYEIGQFVLDSTRFVADNYWRAVKAEEVDDDDGNGKPADKGDGQVRNRAQRNRKR